MSLLRPTFILFLFIELIFSQSLYEFTDVVKQKTFGNKIPQCPCVVHKESSQCVSYDSRYLAANVEEAILAFIDLSNHAYSAQIINSETFRCSSAECRQCFALLFYRLQDVGLVSNNARTSIPPLPRAQLRPELCPKFKFLLQPNIPPTPFAVPTFMRDMINAGKAFGSTQNRNQQQQQSQSQTAPVPPTPSNRQQQNQQNNQNNQNQGQPNPGVPNWQNRPQQQNNQWNQPRPIWNQQNQWQNQRPQQPNFPRPNFPNAGFPNPNGNRPPMQPNRPQWNQPQRPWIPQPPRPPPVQYPPRVPQWNTQVQQPPWNNQWTQQQPAWTTTQPGYTPAYQWPGYQPAVAIPSTIGTSIGSSLGHPLLDLIGGLFGGGGGTSPPQSPGGHSGFGFGGGFRNKRQATGDLGQKFTIGCTNRGEADGELLALCGYCWTWRQLPEDYFPRILNELSCQEGDHCLSGWGMCKQNFRNIDVLHRVNGRWIPTVITSASCCDCRVKAGTEIHSLVVGDKRL